MLATGLDVVWVSGESRPVAGDGITDGPCIWGGTPKIKRNTQDSLNLEMLKDKH